MEFDFVAFRLLIEYLYVKYQYQQLQYFAVYILANEFLCCVYINYYFLLKFIYGYH